MASGHAERAVLHEYSVRKIDLYYRAARERVEAALVDAVAVQHSPKTLLEQLRRKGDGERVMSAKKFRELRDVMRARKAHGTRPRNR